MEKGAWGGGFTCRKVHNLESELAAGTAAQCIHRLQIASDYKAGTAAQCIRRLQIASDYKFKPSIPNPFLTNIWWRKGLCYSAKNGYR